MGKAVSVLDGRMEFGAWIASARAVGVPDAVLQQWPRMKKLGMIATNLEKSDGKFSLYVEAK